MTDKEIVNYIFKVREISGLTWDDLSYLSSVSRSTFFRWMQGKSIRDTLRINLAYAVATRLEKACRNGLLPLSSKLKSPQRKSLLRRIVTDMAAK